MKVALPQPRQRAELAQRADYQALRATLIDFLVKPRNSALAPEQGTQPESPSRMATEVSDAGRREAAQPCGVVDGPLDLSELNAEG